MIEENPEVRIHRNLVTKIEECIQPHDFREVIKSARKANLSGYYVSLVVLRLDSIIAYKGHPVSLEALTEIREEIEDLFTSGGPIALTKESSQKNLNASSYISKKKAKVETTQEVTLRTWKETQGNKKRTANLLGIPVGLLNNRLVKYGAINEQLN